MSSSDKRKSSSSKLVSKKQGLVGGNTVSHISKPQSPELYCRKLMESQGHDSKTFKAMRLTTEPTADQMRDYDNDLVWAVRVSSLPNISQQALDGKTMSACNKYSESIMHMACRRASLEVVRFMHENGASFDQVDDYGRTPLHDACWRAEPCFELIEYILEQRVDLLRSADARGSTPLDYVPKEDWPAWCAFIQSQKDKFWPVMSESSEKS